MKALSLFTGIGGLDLAAEACGIETVAMCEIEEFPVSILKKRWPGIPIYDDVRKIKGSEIIERWGTVDVVHGGFPCQDLSYAGQRRGLTDDSGNVTRSGLWFEMLRIISELRPRFVVGENVRGAVSLALDEVQRGLEDEGYEVRTCLIPASSVGAPHQRERIFVLGIREDVLGIEGEFFGRMGDPNSEVPQGRREPRVLREAQIEPGLAGSLHNAVWRTPDANMTRGAISEEKYIEREKRGMPNALNYQAAHIERANGEEPRGQLNPAWVEQLMGYPDGWTDPDCDEPTPWLGWPAPPNARMWMTPGAVIVGMTAKTTGRPIEKTTILNSQVFAQEHGITEKTGQYPYEHPRTVVGMKNRAKRLKALGNAVVPQQAEPIFRTIQFIDYMIGKGGIL